MRQERFRLAVVHPRLAAWGSGHDTAVWRLACALAARPEVALRVITGPRGPAVPGARLIRLPALPVWHGGLEFLSFRAAWALYRRSLPAGEAVYAGTPLLPGADVAAVHFLSLDWLAGQPAAGLSPRALDAAWRHRLAARLETAAYTAAARAGRPRLAPVSPAVAASLEARFGLRAPQVEVVGNPLDLAAFHPGAEPALRAELLAATGWPVDARVLLFVGGDWARKRLDHAIAALTLLPEPAVLAVLGAGPQAAMRALAAAGGVAARVHFLGPRPDVARFLRLATVLLLPSAYETDGLAGWEALASGVPVVASPLPAFAPWLEDGVTGFAAAGPAAIALAVRRLLADPGLAEAMGAAGRARAAARHPALMAAQVLALLRPEPPP